MQELKGRKETTLSRSDSATMADIEDSNVTAIAAEADDIATAITKFLIDGFKNKTGREPDNNEIEQLFDELTQER